MDELRLSLSVIPTAYILLITRQVVSSGVPTVAKLIPSGVPVSVAYVSALSGVCTQQVTLFARLQST